MTSDDVKEGLYAGLIAGAVFLVLEMLMVPLFLGESAWGPPRMIGAILLGEAALPPPATFNLGIVLVAIVLHFALSSVYGILLAAIIKRRTEGSAILIGVLFGLALYLINFYLFTGLFPWFAMARNWVSIVAHLVFGGVAGYAYKEIKVRYFNQCAVC